MTFCRMDQQPDKAYAKYRGLIRSLINSIVVNNPSVVDYQDLQQVGAMAVVTALQSYDPSQGSLPSYIRRCIRNALLEQANIFNGVFTVDEKVRRRGNQVRKMRRSGMSDEEIMSGLGIKTRATFLSLVELVDSHAVDIEHVEVSADSTLDEKSIMKMLIEIGLSKIEIKFVDLTINNYSMDAIAEQMQLSRSTLYSIKTSIRDKIQAWGQDH